MHHAPQELGLNGAFYSSLFLNAERDSQPLVKLPYMGFKGNLKIDMIISRVFAIAPLKPILHNSGEPGF